MPASRPPRWLWRALLLLPPAVCWAGLLLPGGNLLSDSLAYRLQFQVADGWLLIAPMPNPEELQAWDAALDKLGQEDGGRFVHFRTPAAVYQRSALRIDCLENRQRGFAIVDTWPGARHVIIADWLAALVLSLLALPFLNAIRLTHRRSWRKRHNRCVECGYSLQGLPTPRCPECGLAFHTPASTGRTANDPASANCHY